VGSGPLASPAELGLAPRGLPWEGNKLDSTGIQTFDLRAIRGRDDIAIMAICSYPTIGSRRLDGGWFKALRTRSPLRAFRLRNGLGQEEEDP
jgi:hypothetical protein